MSTAEEKKAISKARGRRLKAAREHMNFRDAKAAARFFRFPANTYSQHENGTRDLKNAVREYAEKFGVTEEWLLFGRNPPPWALGEFGAAEEQGDAQHYLRAWRIYQGQTEADLAERLAIPTDLLQAWESGRQDISDKWLRRAAAALDTTPGAILDADPRAIAPDLLELWLDSTRRQRQVVARVAALRTGT